MGAPARKHGDLAIAAARLEARISKPQKMLFERAAKLRGQSLTDFVIESVQVAAVKAVEEYSVIKLSIEEQQRFVDMLMNSPAPNAALVQAAERFGEMTER